MKKLITVFCIAVCLFFCVPSSETKAEPATLGIIGVSLGAAALGLGAFNTLGGIVHNRRHQSGYYGGGYGGGYSAGYAIPAAYSYPAPMMNYSMAPAYSGYGGYSGGYGGYANYGGYVNQCACVTCCY